jgi:altronate hydrolase
MKETLQGYLRPDGQKGIRNIILVAYMVECARHVAEEIARHFNGNEVQVIGFGGCYPNEYAAKIMRCLCTHANVGAVLLLSLGCEGFNRRRLADHIRSSGRPSHTIVIQQAGGTRRSVSAGIEIIVEMLEQLKTSPRADMRINELIVGTICGGSDATSGITANPAVGWSFDRLVEAGARAIFEETGELVGLEHLISARAADEQLAVALGKAIEKAALYYTLMGHGSFAPGNADGGLSTIEEKSMGAYCKSGTSKISGLIKPGDRPEKSGLYLLDIVPDGEPKFGFPNINDNAEIAELIACGAHLILFTTGRGSVVGSPISPVIKICANPDTYERMKEDMDINAGSILRGESTIEDIGASILGLIVEVAAGTPTCSELLGHREFVLSYKRFAPSGPACLP